MAYFSNGTEGMNYEARWCDDARTSGRRRYWTPLTPARHPSRIDEPRALGGARRGHAPVAFTAQMLREHRVFAPLPVRPLRVRQP